MKRLGFLFLIFWGSAVNAQTVWGLKSGLNVSTLGKDNSIYEAKLGFHAGVYYLQRIEQQYGIQLGLQYSLQGARDSRINKRSQSYNYIHLPFLIRFYLSDNAFVEVGPQASYLLLGNSLDEGIKTNITNDLKRWDFSALVGIGYDTSFGGTAGLRFGWGFVNTSGSTTSGDIVFRNILIQLYLGFKIKEVES